MKSVLFVIALAASVSVHAQTIKIGLVTALSGQSARAGEAITRGLQVAIDEINAKGGILKRKINAPVTDTQSNAGISRAQVQKAIDGDPYVILGPVFSGSVKVNMQLAQAGRGAADRRRGSRRDHADGQPVHLPHLVRAADEHAEDGGLRRERHEGEDRGVPLGEQRLRQGRARRVLPGDEGARHQDRRRRLDRVGPGRLRRRHRQDEGLERRRDVHLHQRGRVRARAARGAAGVRAARASGARVVVTCDCGTNAIAAIRQLCADGVQVIVTDHHLPSGPLPDCLAVLNPRRPDSAYPDKDLAAVGVAFKLALAVPRALGGNENPSSACSTSSRSRRSPTSRRCAARTACSRATGSGCSPRRRTSGCGRSSAPRASTASRSRRAAWATSWRRASTPSDGSATRCAASSAEATS